MSLCDSNKRRIYDNNNNDNNKIDNNNNKIDNKHMIMAIINKKNETIWNASHECAC